MELKSLPKAFKGLLKKKATWKCNRFIVFVQDDCLSYSYAIGVDLDPFENVYDMCTSEPFEVVVDPDKFNMEEVWMKVWKITKKE